MPLSPDRRAASLAIKLPSSREKDGMLALERVPLSFPRSGGAFKKYDPLRPYFHLVDSYEYGRDVVHVHHAQDLMAPKGTPIVAPVAGRVIKNAWNPLGGWTLTVASRLSSGRITWCYFAHMVVPSHRSVGDVVQVGDLLGLVGNTGGAASSKPWQRAAGPTHCHFAVYTESGPGTGDMLQHTSNMYSQLMAMTKPFYTAKDKGKIPLHPGMSNIRKTLDPTQFRTWSEDPDYVLRLWPEVTLAWSRALALLIANNQPTE